MTDSKASYKEISLVLETFAIYNNGESEQTIKETMKLLEIPENRKNILTQPTSNLVQTWISFLKSSKSNYLCLMLCLHAYTDNNGNSIFEGGNLTKWLPVDEVNGFSLYHVTMPMLISIHV
jgi:hypothetical protein